MVTDDETEKGREMKTETLSETETDGIIHYRVTLQDFSQGKLGGWQRNFPLQCLIIHCLPLLALSPLTDATTLYYLQRFRVGHVEPCETGGHAPRPRVLVRFQESDLCVKQNDLIISVHRRFFVRTNLSSSRSRAVLDPGVRGRDGLGLLEAVGGGRQDLVDPAVGEHIVNCGHQWAAEQERWVANNMMYYITQLTVLSSG